MVELAEQLNPAEEASEQTLESVYRCLENNQSFLVEAGAGAGKTYTLVKALRFLINDCQHTLQRKQQQIACITFTNVAKDEIISRTDRSPVIYSDTIHGFCWSLIKIFQKQLREQLPQLNRWPQIISKVGDLGERTVEYNLGYRKIDDLSVSIHHDDVLILTISLMKNAKFRNILTSKFPIILIDEYQDTNEEWINSIKSHFLGKKKSPQFGFFGDHWQKIYGDGCGKIEHHKLITIGKNANFRSVSAVVNCLNRMRPDLPQFVVDPNEQGSVRIFHTNTWTGERQTSSHWKDDLLPYDADRAFQIVQNRLSENGWNFSQKSTKFLMLTHNSLASKQGYPSLPKAFRFNQSFTKKEHPHIAYFTDVLEPACEAHLSRKYGAMLSAFGSRGAVVHSPIDKIIWSKAMEKLIELRERGTVGAVLDHLLSIDQLRIPNAVKRREHELRRFEPDKSGQMSIVLKEIKKLREVPYQEIVALSNYLLGHSPFETKHGVKGAEFENVLVVVGRGWNRYNFGDMLELATDTTSIPSNRRDAFERNRNLFYVTCSRPKKRLAVLFTQRLSDKAMQTVRNWFGQEALEGLNL